MGRSLKRGPSADPMLLDKDDQLNATGVTRLIKTWSLRSTSFSSFIGHTFAVHDGRRHVHDLVTENMVGHKLGEFSQTKTFKGHAGGTGQSTRMRK